MHQAIRELAADVSANNTVPEATMSAWLRMMRYRAGQPVTSSELGMPESAAAVEILLREHLPQFLAEIDKHETFVAVPDRDIHDIEGYGLTPIPGRIYQTRSKGAGQFAEPIDPAVSVTFYEDCRFIALDAGFGIGLTYRGWLVGVSAAFVDDRGYIVIPQLQDVTSVRKSQGKQYYKTGLQQGMLWRHSLVAVWETIAERVGATGIAVQSHTESEYEKVRKYGKAGLDDVAHARGYQYHAETKVWEKSLALCAAPPQERTFFQGLLNFLRFSL